MAPKSNSGRHGFSSRELRALLWLLPALAVVAWLTWEAGSARFNGGQAGLETSTAVSSPAVEVEVAAETGPEATPTPAPELFAFDPNTIEYHDLIRLGFTRNESLGIIKYRERGKIFEIPEDFAACYQVSESMYRRLEPYIRIGEQFRLKKWAETGANTRTETRTEGPAGNASAAEVRTTIEVPSTLPPPATGAFRSDGPVERRRRPLVDLNTADSTALIAVSGIGERTVVTIMEYREHLGGFVDVRQLAEVRGMTEQNYERIIEQIFIDPAVVRKININFAPAKTLASHPYMRAGALRELLKQRQLKGGWRTVEELAQDDIFTAEELERLVPYLDF